MAKRPPKPEGIAAKPRHKATKVPTLATAIENSRKLIDLRPDVNDDDDYLKVFQIDDRSFAVLRAANLENNLEISLSDLLTVHPGEKRNLFRSEGPLGTFSNKITMAYALNIIGPKTKKNLDVVRHVRNTFAHAKKHVSFESKEIIGLCEHLDVPSLTMKKIEEQSGDPKISASIDAWPNAKTAFFVVAMVIEISLTEMRIKNLRHTIKDLGGKEEAPKSPPIEFDESLP